MPVSIRRQVNTCGPKPPLKTDQRLPKAARKRRRPALLADSALWYITRSTVARRDPICVDAKSTYGSKQVMKFRERETDRFLTTRIDKYNKWLHDGGISFSSRVIPIAESVRARQTVFPTPNALEILNRARLIALQNCECRAHYKRCDKPLETCITLNDVGDRSIKKGRARRITLEEARAVLKQANENGLIHLSLYMPNHELFALCNCCSCCCHDLQILKVYGRTDLVVRSEYIAVTDQTECTNCGDCVDRCVFEARIIEDDVMRFAPDKCLGCGLCTTSCPVEAITLQRFIR